MAEVLSRQTAAEIENEMESNQTEIKENVLERERSFKRTRKRWNKDKNSEASTFEKKEFKT